MKRRAEKKQVTRFWRGIRRIRRRLLDRHDRVDERMAENISQELTTTKLLSVSARWRGFALAWPVFGLPRLEEQ